VLIESADRQKSEEAEFIMLKDGGIIFEGPAGELKRSNDPYLKTFLS
jgi:ABC-type transporter Mla maintaining outer membrane lipid asymmetry ATPase subunit MlaF